MPTAKPALPRSTKARKPSAKKAGLAGKRKSPKAQAGSLVGNLLKTIRSGKKSGKVPSFPETAVPLILQVLEGISEGKDVKVVATPKELTTYQAAEILHVSRPYLVRLLESGAIPFHMVGTHHRVKLDDLLAYKAAKTARRKAVLAEMTALNQEIERERQ